MAKSGTQVLTVQTKGCVTAMTIVKPISGEGLLVIASGVNGYGMDGSLLASSPALLSAIKAIKGLALPGATHIHKICDDTIALAEGGK